GRKPAACSWRPEAFGVFPHFDRPARRGMRARVNYRSPVCKAALPGATQLRFCCGALMIDYIGGFLSASRAIFVTQIVTMIVAARPTVINVQYCQPCFTASPPAAAETAALPAVPI